MAKSMSTKLFIQQQSSVVYISLDLVSYDLGRNTGSLHPARLVVSFEWYKVFSDSFGHVLLSQLMRSLCLFSHSSEIIWSFFY